jgi:glycosyltransferase 2 family protein
MKSVGPGTIIARVGLWLLFFAIAAGTATALFADLGRVRVLLASVEPGRFLLMMIAVLGNYALRYGKWRFFLGRLGIRLPWRDDLWIFLSAFTMVLSPGKIGEVVKSLWLKARFGLPVARTAPVVVAERLTDLLGLLVLAGWGWSRFAYGGNLLLTLGSGLVLLIGLMTRPWFWAAIDRLLLSRWKRLEPLRRPFRVLEDSTGTLLSPSALAVAVPLSAVSWAGEGVALYIIFGALNVDLPDLLAIAVFAHAFSSILGAVSFLPGGLLVTEGALGMFFVFAGMASEVAVSATLLIRAVTLWFAVLLGTTVLLLGRRPGDFAVLEPAPAAPPAPLTPATPPTDSAL